MRRGLRREYAFDAPLAETFRILREALGKVVAHERGGDRAAGRNAEPGTDCRRPQQRYPVARQILPYGPQHAQADARCMAAKRQPFLHGEQDFADPEKPDDCDEKVDAAQEIAEPEGHAQLTGYGVHSDAGEQEAERHGNDGFVFRFAPEAYERTKSEEIDGENLKRPKSQSARGDSKSKKGDEKHRKERADE